MSERQKPGGGSVNQGIQATNVSADVIAVGTGASAHKSVVYHAAQRADAVDRIGELEAALQKLVESESARAALAEEVESLRAAVDTKQPDQDAVVRTLGSLRGKLSMIGVVLEEVVELATPIKALTGLLGIPLKLLGW